MNPLFYTIYVLTDPNNIDEEYTDDNNSFVKKIFTFFGFLVVVIVIISFL